MVNEFSPDQVCGDEDLYQEEESASNRVPAPRPYPCVVDVSKNLGETIKDDLLWDTHVQTIVAKAKRADGFLRRNQKDCKPPVNDTAYKTIVQPFLKYASTVWDYHTQANVKRLEQVQRRASRFVYNDYRTRTPGCITQMLNNLKWDLLKSDENTTGSA